MLGAALAKSLAEGKLGNFKVSDFKDAVKTKTTPPEQVADDQAKRDRTESDDAPRNPRPRINMIMGGSHFCQDTVSSIKAFQRKATSIPQQSLDHTIPEHNIFFTEEDARGIAHPHNDPLVVELVVNDFEVARILIDTGSTVDVIFKETLKRMNVPLADITPNPKPLTSFSGDTTMTLGTIKLPVQAEGITRIVDFSVADHPAIYNLILGTPWLNSMRVVPSPYHLCIKFPTLTGLGTIRGSQKESRMCMLAEHKLRQPVTDRKPAAETKKSKIDHDDAKQLSIAL